MPEFSAEASRSSAASMPGTFPPSVVSFSAPAGGASPSSEDRPKIATKFEVDQDKPSTSIQIRLADGTRFVFCPRSEPLLIDPQNGGSYEFDPHRWRYKKFYQCVSYFL